MKRALFYILGLIVSAFGVTTIYTANVGVGAWDTVYIGFNKHFNSISIGTWIFIICTLIMFLNSFLIKEKLDLPAFLTIIVLGFLVDFFLKFVYDGVHLDSLLLKWLYFVVGLFLTVLGATSYLQAKFAANPIDKLMYSLNTRFGISIRVARTMCEVFALTLGFFLGGPVSLGTAIITILIGPSIQFASKPIGRLYNKL